MNLLKLFLDAAFEVRTLDELDFGEEKFSQKCMTGPGGAPRMASEHTIPSTAG